MVTYLMITKSCASMVLGVEDVTKQQIVLLIISLVVQLPLACMRDMADLEKTSGIAVAIDCTIVALVAFSSPWIEMKGMEQSTLWDLMDTDAVHPGTLFVGLGVLSFAFECQEAAFLVAGSLQKPTVARWARVTSIALVACVILAMVCAVTGYLGYGAKTSGNILENLDPSTRTTYVAHGMLGATMFATYPLASFVARHVCVVLLFEGRKAHEGGSDSTILNRADRRILLTSVLYILAIIPATIYTDMGKVLALAGVVGGSCLAYIGPGMLFLAVHGGRFLDLVDEFFYIQTTNKDTKQDKLVSETTALVVDSKKPEEEPTRKTFNGCFRAVLFYLGGLPVWCRIAMHGKNAVLAHAKTLVAQNTIEALRIGEVDPTGIEKLVENGDASDSAKNGRSEPLAHLARPRSDNNLDFYPENGLLETEYASTNSSVVTKQSGALKSKELSSLEPDPQAAPPSWRDYFIAVFYICFGCLALFAGLISLGSNY